MQKNKMDLDHTTNNNNNNNNNNELTNFTSHAEATPFANIRKLHETYTADSPHIPIHSVNIPKLAQELLHPSCTKVQAVAKMAQLVYYQHQNTLFKLLMHPPPATESASNLVQMLPPEILCLIMKQVALGLRQDFPYGPLCTLLTRRVARLKKLHSLGLVCKDFYCALWDPSVLRPVYQHYLGYPSLQAHFNLYQRVKPTNHAAAASSNIAFGLLAGNGEKFTNYMLSLFDMKTTAPYLWSLVTSTDTSALIKARCWQRLYRQQWSWMNLISFGLCRNNSQSTIKKTVSLLEYGLRHKIATAVRYMARFGAAHQKTYVRPIICTCCAQPLWVEKKKCFPHYRRAWKYHSQADVTLLPCGALCKRCVHTQLKTCCLTDLEAPVPASVFLYAGTTTVLRRDYAPLVASGLIYDLFLSKIPMPMRMRREQGTPAATKPPAKKRQKTTAL